jgi:hypothetical protein
MRKFLMYLLMIVPLYANSQDVIVLRNGTRVDCKITRIENNTLYYDFFKGDRKLSTYIAISDVRSYTIHEEEPAGENVQGALMMQNNVVHIDTTRYVKVRSQWINLVTFSPKFGINSLGASLQYTGYNVRSDSRWSIPILFGFERFSISQDYFERTGYQQASMSYMTAGLKPFYKINDNFFLNFGILFVMGEENLMGNYAREENNTFFGITPSQGIYFIPSAKSGITLGFSLFQKAISSNVYKSDFGLSLEIGVKF